MLLIAKQYDLSSSWTEPSAARRSFLEDRICFTRRWINKYSGSAKMRSFSPLDLSHPQRARHNFIEHQLRRTWVINLNVAHKLYLYYASPCTSAALL